MGLNGCEEPVAAGTSPPPPGSRFRYNSPLIQVILIGLVCFCCPGMFNAFSGMGGGGQVDHMMANNANTNLYTTFVVFSIIGGGIYNVLGHRLTLLAGCSTYCLYAGSFLNYNNHHSQPFFIVAGALLGIETDLLWAGQGAIMTSYPTPAKKGIYISLLWSIFNMGGVIGGLIPFLLNYKRETTSSVNDGVIGGLIEIVKLFLNWKMILILSSAWASNFFYTYQFNNVNGELFNGISCNFH